jgi:para-nitrobenzyl esterase
MMDRRRFVRTSALGAAALLLHRNHLLAQTSGSPGAIADTTAGKVRGLLIDRVQAFKGVPYGESTTGARRFLPPVKATAWTGVRETFTWGHRSPQAIATFVPEWQPLTGTESMGEDCLHLNVWTPDATRRSKRPVMAWLHGGGYTGGSPAAIPYNGAQLARKHDVVVVSITHRLNVVGFIHLSEIAGEQFADASNAGMKDMVAGLEWIRDNIAAFGGDPGNVTIFGQSGGAGKVSTLLGMPAAQGLFHRAIAQSGSAVTGMPAATASENAEALMSRLNLKPHQADALQQLPIEQVIAAMQPAGGRGGRGAARGSAAGVNIGGRGAGGGFQTSPVVDGHSLPHDVFNPTATALSAKIPLLIGSTETEVTWSVGTDYTEPADETALRERVKRALRTDDAHAASVVTAARSQRPKAGLLDLALIIETDASQFRTGVDLEAERKSAQGGAPVYMYRFQWYSPVSGGRLRAMHCMDIPFAFDTVDASASIVGTESNRQPLSNKMSNAWVAFARSGSPNHAGLPKWDPFDAQKRATMMFSDECKVANDPYRDERLAIADARRIG